MISENLGELTEEQRTMLAEARAQGFVMPKGSAETARAKVLETYGFLRSAGTRKGPGEWDWPVWEPAQR